MADVDSKTKEYIGSLKSRFANKEERENLTDRELLIMLVANTRCSADPITVADNLLKTFGSYRNCILAHYKELIQVDGVTHNTAMLILLVASVYGTPRKKPAIGKRVKDIEKLFLDCVPRKRDEELYIAMLDQKYRLIDFERLAKGRPNTVSLEIGDVIDVLARSKASKVVLGHTHPGTAVSQMSDQDAETLEMLGSVLDKFKVEFIGQVIVTDKEAKLFRYTSKNQSGAM